MTALLYCVTASYVIASYVAMFVFLRNEWPKSLNKRYGNEPEPFNAALWAASPITAPACVLFWAFSLDEDGFSIAAWVDRTLLTRKKVSK